MNTKPLSFSAQVAKKLGCYVYRLIDPRNGETFYVGRGQNNRVFNHINEHIKSSADAEEDENLKLGTIKAIRTEGLEPIHVIHRHGMDEDTAKIVEAALIDAYPAASNLKSGDDSGDYGAMRAEQIIRRYSAEPFSLDHGHKLLLIKINRSYGNYVDVYEAVRSAWVLNPERAGQADYILALAKGLVVGTFKAHEWKAVKVQNDNGAKTTLRWEFEGTPAPEEIQQLYIEKVVPEKLRGGKGAASPIRYSW